MAMKVAYKKQLKNIILDVDVEIPDKGISVLFGPSGAGKSSLLNLLAGIDISQAKKIQCAEITAAHFILNQRVIEDLENKINTKPWHRNIAYVFQDHRLFPNMTVKENILYGYKRRSSQLNIEKVIDQFKINDLLNHMPAQLSGGQKQRVAMVRALLSNPQLLILDEPLASLDYASRQQLLPYIECIHKELDIPIIYVSHDIKEVLRLADYVLIMDQGKIIDQGEIADLCISQPLLTQQEGASFILQGRVEGIIEQDKLVEIKVEDQTLLITSEHLKLQQKVRLLIHARDVSLCLQPPVDSSILNCIAICIEQLQTDKNGKLKVIAKIGEQILVSLISHRSARQLKIEKGKKLFAQFKATAMIK